MIRRCALTVAANMVRQPTSDTHSAMSRLLLTVVLTAATACSVRVDSGEVHSDSATSAAGGYRTTRIGALSDTVLHLAGGDSAELQSAGSVQVPNEPDGLMVTYHPFAKTTDTAYLKRTALAVFDAVRPHFTNGEPPWIVLRAANRTAAERNAGGHDRFYGVVLEKHADGRWYPLHESTPVR